MKNSISLYILTAITSFFCIGVGISHAWGCSLGFICPDIGKIDYCKDGKCTISGGLMATEPALGDNFSKKSLAQYVSDVVRYFLGFVTIAAVVYILYAGLRLMTGGGDEENTKKARQIIIYVIAGIILMWLSYWIVMLLLDAVK